MYVLWLTLAVLEVWGAYEENHLHGWLTRWGLRPAHARGSGCLDVLLRVPRPLRGLLLDLRKTPRQPEPCVAQFVRLQKQPGVVSGVSGICSRVPSPQCQHATEGGWWGPQAQAALAVATKWACQPTC